MKSPWKRKHKRHQSRKWKSPPKPLIKLLKDAGQKPPKELKQMAKLMKAATPSAPTINQRAKSAGGLYD